MSDARNYPRLCWGCLGGIESAEDDNALLNYGGYCDACAEIRKMPGLHAALRGETERMNNVSEREDLLREARKSEPAQGGFIQQSGIALVTGETGPEYLWPGSTETAKEPLPMILSGDKAREFIRREVREALEQELQPGAIDPREYMHIDVREMDGRRWRGIVYAVEPLAGEE